MQRTMWLPDSPHDSLASSSPPTTLGGEDESEYATILSILEDDVAFLENDLYASKYALEDLNPGIHDTKAIKGRASQVYKELNTAKADLERLFQRLAHLSPDAHDLGDISDADKVLRRQYVIIEKTLNAAKQMRRELRSLANTAYYQANGFERVQEGETVTAV